MVCLTWTPSNKVFLMPTHIVAYDLIQHMMLSSGRSKLLKMLGIVISLGLNTTNLLWNFTFRVLISRKRMRNIESLKEK